MSDGHALADATTYLGIELGSTRIKACLVGADHRPLATGQHAWESHLDGAVWTYGLDEVWSGLREAVADVLRAFGQTYGRPPTAVEGMGVSAMMHGYLAFDAAGEALVPFRTWRNTSTAAAADLLSRRLHQNIPMRWSVAHLVQAVLDEEPHLPRLQFLTTLAGYVHWQLTGQKVLGVGDASGMFPIDADTGQYDATLLSEADALLDEHGFAGGLLDLLPAVRPAGQEAGRLTPEAAERLDPSGVLRPGIPLCPPEGDAGTGMVATHSIAPRTGSVSVGTSVFAMVVLDRPLHEPRVQIDLVVTPDGAPVAMVHCNNGANELEQWVGVFREFARALGGDDAGADHVFETLLAQALQGQPDAGGVLAYNYVTGEPIVDDLPAGRPIVVRSPQRDLTLANLCRALVHGVFGTLSLGIRALADEGVQLDRLVAHGGIFRTEGVAQRLLAAALDAPVAVGRSSAEGGAWGMALLAAFMGSSEPDLARFLSESVFGHDDLAVVEPDSCDVRGYREFLARYEAGMPLERVAVDVL